MFIDLRSYENKRTFSTREINVQIRIVINIEQGYTICRFSSNHNLSNLFFILQLKDFLYFLVHLNVK